jgi:hypothetical protein
VGWYESLSSLRQVQRSRLSWLQPSIRAESNGSLDHAVHRRHQAVDGRRLLADGIGKNRKTLEAMTTYAHEQGLIKQKYDIEALFESASIIMSRETNKYE